jgi:hypothetical protein
MRVVRATEALRDRREKLEGLGKYLVAVWRSATSEFRLKFSVERTVLP